MTRRNIRKISDFSRDVVALSRQVRELAEDISKLVDMAPEGTVLARIATGIGAIQRVPVSDFLDAASAVLVRLAGVDVGTRHTLNFIEGSNISLTVADDAANAEIDITITGTSVSGTYTATLTGVTNVASTNYGNAMYARVGDTVMVWGRAEITPTSAEIATELGISLPIASNLASSTDLSGASSGNGSADSAYLYGDTTNDRATLTFIPTNTNAHSFWFTFGYRVLQ